MFTAKAAFGGFSVNDLAAAKKFYTEILGLKLANEEMGLQLQLPNGGTVFVYDKPNHEPASFTIMNFVVDNIDAAVDELSKAGVQFERYPDMHQDDKGIARGRSQNMGPDIAWFKDPSGNIVAVLQDE